MLQKEKERFANQLEAKRRASEKLEKFNQAKVQIEKIQREIDEMKEQENSSLWCNSLDQNSGQHKRMPRENFFIGNGISPFTDTESPLSLGLQTAPWPPKYKPVSLPKYNGYGHSRQFIMSYEAAVNSEEGMMLRWPNLSLLLVKVQSSTGIPCCLHIQFAAGLTSR
jgi:hypothetical protein